MEGHSPSYLRDEGARDLAPSRKCSPSNGAVGVLVMRPVKRKPVSKFRSAKKFRRDSRKTKAANVKGPMRGGIRL